MIPAVSFSSPLSGNRFSVVYRIEATAQEAEARARAIAWEQTVEFPEDLLPEGDLRTHIPGRIEGLHPDGPGWFRAVISYPDEAAGGDFTQFLNVLFGNTSLQPGVRVLDTGFPAGVAPGPRYGIRGLRDLLEVPRRPLASTALKPMGLPLSELALQAYQAALGGLDLIKDDHGLADQVFSPFQFRVDRCVEAVRAANKETGARSVYAPNITADPQTALARARFAQDAGAGAVLVSPGLAGFGLISLLAAAPWFKLPIIAHPAFTGSFVSAGPGGVDHGLFYGTLMRAAGADITIFPNLGGRFSFTEAQCLSIVDRARGPLAALAPAFPSPGGGMGLTRIPDQKRLYGEDFVALVGGGLHREASSLVEASRALVSALGSGAS